MPATTPAERIQEAMRTPGKHSFGNSLFLITRPSGKGYWVQQYRDGQSFRSKSLGTIANPKLNSYSKAVMAAKRFAVDRDDKKELDEATEVAGPLFSILVSEYLEGYDSDGERVPGKVEGWRGGVTGAEADTYRRNLIERGKLAAMYAAKITPQDIAAHLRLFEGKPKTAERVRSHIENVMAFAIAREIRPEGSDNPASPDGPLKYLPWPKVDHSNDTVVPHPAMPAKDVPKFFRDLQTVPTGQAGDPNITPSAKALSFIVLTAVRAQEAVGAKWNEMDLESMVWTVPGSRMKGKGAGRPHAVPPTAEMLAIIGKPGAPDDYIFPGDADGHVGEKSPMHTLRTLYKGEADVHGFRSTFSDWVVDHTDINDRERLVDLALAHLKHRDKTQRQYLRSTRLEQRRPVMQRWNEYVTSFTRSARQ